MSDLDNAIQSINTAAARTEGTTDFIDNLSTYDENSSVTNPNNGVTVPSIAKRVKTRTDELFEGAESDINQSVADAAKSASDAEASALSLGYQGLWPDTGGSALKGDTYQTQVGGTPTGQYFTALQDTSADPVGDDVNWRNVVTDSRIDAIEAKNAQQDDRLTVNESDISALQDGQQSGVIVFSTYALLDAYTPTVDEQRGSFKVTNDTDRNLNGYYSWVSGTTYTKDASLVANLVSKDNISDPISGAGVYYNNEKDYTSINAIDESAITWGLYIPDNGIGELRTTISGEDGISDYIFVGDMDTVAVSSVREMASPWGIYYYDASRNWIATGQPETTGVSTGQSGYANIPSNAVYMRYTILNTHPNHTCTLGATRTGEYTPYERVLSGKRIPYVIDSVSATNDKLVSLTEYKNIFDKSTAELGYYINSSGAIVYEAGNYDYVSNYINVAGKDSVIFNDSFRVPAGLYGLNFYNARKTYLTTVTQSDLSFSVPTAAAYIRLTIKASAINEAHGNYGTVLNDYSEHREEFSQELLWRVYEGEQSVSGSPTFNIDKLVETKKRLRNLSLGLYDDSLRVLMIGDSWTHSEDWYSKNVNTILKRDYGDSGIGYASFGWLAYGSGLPRPSGLNGNIDPSICDVALYGSWVPEYADQPTMDICSTSSSIVGDYVEITSTAKTDNCIIYVRSPDGGSVSYQFDDETPVTLEVTANDRSFGVLVPNTGGAFTLKIEILSGTIFMDGCYLYNNSNGVICSKLGATGSRLSQWAIQAQTKGFKSSISESQANLVTILHGTNDQNSNRTRAQFKTDCETLVTSVKESLPDADILLITPPENGGSGVSNIAMSEYSKAMREVATSNNIAHLDLQSFYGANYSEYGFGSTRGWFRSDNIHPTDEGGAIVNTDAILKQILS